MTPSPNPETDFAYEPLSEGTVRIIGLNDRTLDTVVIPAKINGKSVAEIDSEAFSFCSSLTSVVIPKSVKEIGKDAFKGCSFSSSVGVDENR